MWNWNLSMLRYTHTLNRYGEHDKHYNRRNTNVPTSSLCCRAAVSIQPKAFGLNSASRKPGSPTCFSVFIKTLLHYLSSAYYKDISCQRHLETAWSWMRCARLSERETSVVWEALHWVSETHLWVMLQRAWTKVHTPVGAKAPHRDPWEAVDHVS